MMHWALLALFVIAILLAVFKFGLFKSQIVGA